MLRLWGRTGIVGPEDGLGYRIIDTDSFTVVKWVFSFLPMPAYLVPTPTYLPWVWLEPQGWNKSRS